MIKDIEILSQNLQAVIEKSNHVGDNGQSSGGVRYNTIKQTLEAYDGTQWVQISKSIKIGLDPEAEAALNWAKVQMKQRESLLGILEKDMDKYPSLKEAYEHFKTIAALVYEERSQ